MKTPEEIKKGLECCLVTSNCDDSCHYKNYGQDLHCDCVMLGKDALAYITQLEAALPKWIGADVEPPKNGRYLVCTKRRGDYTGVHTATYNGMGWWMHVDCGEVTHWMLEPAPPEDVKKLLSTKEEP